MAYSAPKTSSSHSLPKKNETQSNTENQDTLSFQKGGAPRSASLGGLFSNTEKGSGVGTVFSNTAKCGAVGTTLGLFAITALAAANGLSTPRALRGMYAAAFGTAGLIAGKALDDAEKSKIAKKVA